ncbi:Arrestin domain-containing protein 17 [Amphibalanus amphitrite]|uniref:Arrestin domain-containing protein 17 n=1 Tax=Amphibalanus amphitrite TaxID=1232801 RepID=A0A6A4VZA6_AMPAM|nr:Arrestin domain-containing protein 17 [Amphibalanus amphitrite]KAF0298974.1 Arrestin domain-containing protein 17 [Amphibalanus amphitrite]
MESEESVLARGDVDIVGAGLKLVVEGETVCGDPIPLSAGIHSFPFQLGLPLGVPSTFLGKHGWVQYFCRAAIKEESGLVHKNQQVFIVMSPIDLNLEPPALAEPFHCEVEHKLGMSCISSGPVLCRLKLDRGGFVPGESIGIWATINNRSKVTIKRTTASLTETIHYLSKNKVVNTEVRELCRVSRGKVRPADSDDWKNEQLVVPPLPPSNLRGCHLIAIQYNVMFTVKPDSLEKEVKLQLPITLASYPYRNADGTLRKKRGAHYPNTLPMMRTPSVGAADTKTAA